MIVKFAALCPSVGADRRSVLGPTKFTPETWELEYAEVMTKVPVANAAG
jgi:hypothetical protein